MPVNRGYSHILYFCTMKRNILALYLIKLSKWFTLVMPIIVLFYEKHGLGLQDVFILKSVYSVAAVALEIPSGYLADVWGRRKCLICGCILFFFGYLCYSFTSTFTAFLFAEILLGTGQTMVNGADSALLYDTTAQYKKENLYLRYEGRITMIGNFAEALAGIFGGLLAAYSLRFPFYGQAIIAFTGIPAAFALKEINRSGKIRNPVGLAALWSDRVDNYFGPRKMGILILAVIVGGYVALAFNLTYAGLAILLVFYIFRGFATPILKGYINQMTFSEMRATVLSIRNFIIRLMFAAIAPFIGWLNDMYSLQAALLVSAGIILLPGGIFLVLQFRKETD